MPLSVNSLSGPAPTDNLAHMAELRCASSPWLLVNLWGYSLVHVADVQTLHRMTGQSAFSIVCIFYTCQSAYLTRANNLNEKLAQTNIFIYCEQNLELLVNIVKEAAIFKSDVQLT